MVQTNLISQEIMSLKVLFEKFINIMFSMKIAQMSNDSTTCHPVGYQPRVLIQVVVGYSASHCIAYNLHVFPALTSVSTFDEPRKKKGLTLPRNAVRHLHFVRCVDNLSVFRRCQGSRLHSL